MPANHAKRYDQARLLETVIQLKQNHAKQITAQAIEHARAAIETNDAEHARKATALRDDATWWAKSIERNRRELAELHGEL